LPQPTPLMLDLATGRKTVAKSPLGATVYAGAVSKPKYY